MSIGHFEFHPTESQYGWLIKRELAQAAGGSVTFGRYFGPPLDFFFNTILWAVLASLLTSLLATSCH